MPAASMAEELAADMAAVPAADTAAVPAAHDHRAAADRTAVADCMAEDERILGYCNLHTAAAAAGCTMVVVRLLVEQVAADILDLQTQIFHVYQR